jgi:LAS superfamily LD-carboxypeptidase LdcB
MPASQCSPPTAIPGTSEHERGLAIDFRCNGQSIGQRARSNPCFVWLSRHAAEYGFYNLPSEAWHWSTTGR